MARQNDNTRSALDASEQEGQESTLLPMLLAGLVLIVIGAGVIMTVV